MCAHRVSLFFCVSMGSPCAVLCEVWGSVISQRSSSRCWINTFFIKRPRMDLLFKGLSKAHLFDDARDRCFLMIPRLICDWNPSFRVVHTARLKFAVTFVHARFNKLHSITVCSKCLYFLFIIFLGILFFCDLSAHTNGLELLLCS